jgi:hypothetical protein
MEFLIGFLVQFLGINSSILKIKFLSGFLASFSINKMLFEFSCFADFLYDF